METSNYLKRLKDLTSQTEPKFGQMTAQHMVEHLALTLKLSYGKVKIPEFEVQEKHLQQKFLLLRTEMEFPRGVRIPGTSGELTDLRYPDFETATGELIKSFEVYSEYFKNNPHSKTWHPRFGPLDFEEWEIFHAKHIQHHFSQFGI